MVLPVQGVTEICMSPRKRRTQCNVVSLWMLMTSKVTVLPVAVLTATCALPRKRRPKCEVDTF